MVYLLANWGMGDSDLTARNSHYANTCSAQSSHDLLRLQQENEDDEIALHPLSNQVGGHTRLLLLNQSTICKPLNYRELDFYQNIPRDIQMFVPKYKAKMLGESEPPDKAGCIVGRSVRQLAATQTFDVPPMTGMKTSSARSSLAR